jgi:CheY-like chemotaxis protein
MFMFQTIETGGVAFCHTPTSDAQLISPTLTFLYEETPINTMFFERKSALATRLPLPLVGSAPPMDKILVVDDDQESRDLLCEVLETNGYAPYAVADGIAAREVLRRDPDYRIVVADLQMPQESGLELLRKLRQENSNHEVILMSSFMSAAEVKAAKALGVHALLDKPFQLSELLQTVAELAAQDSIGIST